MIAVAMMSWPLPFGVLALTWKLWTPEGRSEAFRFKVLVAVPLVVVKTVVP
jgi:hypothetical protein